MTRKGNETGVVYIEFCDEGKRELISIPQLNKSFQQQLFEYLVLETNMNHDLGFFIRNHVASYLPRQHLQTLQLIQRIFLSNVNQQ